MSIEQTKYFRDEVDHMVRLANEWRYTNKATEIFTMKIEQLLKFRGKDFTRKAIAKANQRIHAKVYRMEAM